MSAIPKRKLCWNCEGNVAWQQEDCPYCGVYLQESQLEGSQTDYRRATQISALNPPYRLDKAASATTTALFGSKQGESLDDQFEEEYAAEANAAASQDHLLWSLVFLLTGSLSLAFGLILLLFSQDGVLTLSWNGEYWYLYTLVGLPALVAGWRALKRLDR